MNNNNIPYGNEGVDNLAPNPSITQQQQAEYNDAQPALEGAGQPSINPNTNMPSVEYGTGIPDQRSGGYIQAGTILSSDTFNVSDSGIKRVSSYSHNTSAEAERRMRLEEQRARQTGRSIYQTAVTNTPSVAPNVNDGIRPSAEKLEEMRKEQKYQDMQRRLRSLKLDEGRQESRLQSTRRAISNLQIELEKLEELEDQES